MIIDLPYLANSQEPRDPMNEHHVHLSPWDYKQSSLRKKRFNIEIKGGFGLENSLMKAWNASSDLIEAIF
jgi:hypothetical protein